VITHRWMAIAPALAVSTAAEAAVLRVPSEYLTIQAGVDAASAGDTVLVAPGTYADYETRPIATGTWTSCVFLKSGVVVRSEGGSGATTVHLPVAAAQPSVVYGEYMPSITTTFEGFTITSVPLGFSAVWVIGSGKVTFRDCEFRDLEGFITNAGLNVNSGDVDVLGCRFIRCRTQLAAGAGIYHSVGAIAIRDSYFEECDGRAVFIVATEVGGEAILENSVFRNCRAGSGGGGGGVAIGSRPGGATIRGCTFVGNSAGAGGAVSVGGAGAKVIEDCLFLFNQANGGGAVTVAGIATIRHNTFVGNAKIGTGGGGAAIQFSTPSSTGSVLEGNVIVSSTDAAAVHGTTTVGPLTSGCNVFWNNALGNASGTYSVGATDREADPLFCNEVGGDYTLRQGSPCLPENSQGCGQIGAFGEGCGIVSIEPQTWGKIKDAYREGGRP
jgi:hypothetical protein